MSLQSARDRSGNRFLSACGRQKIIGADSPVRPGGSDAPKLAGLMKTSLFGTNLLALIDFYGII
jgi:hypothetical protein